MTRLAAVAEKALDGRSIAKAARDVPMPYQRLWDIIHGKSVNPQAETIDDLVRLGVPLEDVMQAIRLDRAARTAHPEEDKLVTA